MFRAFCIIVFIVSAIIASYAGWSLHRISAAVMVREGNSWPRAWPYPDGWLLALNDWYDARYPAARGTVKLHGEIDRVQLTLLVVLAASATVGLCGALPVAWPWIRRSKGGHGFEVVRSPASGSGRLRWQSQWGYQIATDATCYYIRESGGSMIAGGVFATVFAVGGLGYGGHLLMTDPTAGARVFACLCLLVGAVFACVLGSCVWNGRWMIVYDRGGPGAPGEIRLRGKRLPAERIRSISTRHSGGSAGNPQRIVVAELHDGTFEILGPSGVSTWPDHWGQQAATWMGLPFRQSTK